MDKLMMIKKMTLPEKIGMIHGNSLLMNGSVGRLGIPSLVMSDGPNGVRPEQKKEEFSPADCEDDASTYLPVLSALAATWNPDLAGDFGSVLGSEARCRGKDVLLGPGINIVRTPLCGRNFEYMSEDPHLIAQLVVPYIQAVQSYDVAACVKHFALNNQEYKRHCVDVRLSERALHEIYLPGFKAAVMQGGVLAVMGAYNLFNGQHCCHNHYLLNQVLKDEWRFGGIVISDWNGTHDTQEATLNGLDIEMGTLIPGTENCRDFDNYYMARPLLSKVEHGEIPKALIDAKVKRILSVMDKLKLLGGQRRTGQFNTAKHQHIALDVAREAIVLLKNEEKKLPLSSSVQRIAVIGDNAVRHHAFGGGSAEIKALYEITPLEALQKRFDGSETSINFAQGYTTESPVPSLQIINEAVKCAERSEAAIIFGGLNHDFDKESFDRQDMKLPYGQNELIKAVSEVNSNTIVVLISGSPVEMHEWIDDVSAVVYVSYAGMEGGTAITEVLFGDVNPSGKLPVTFPIKLEDSPAHVYGDYLEDNLMLEYKEDIFVGYRYFDTKQVKPQFCFGHGLSYTTFNYDNLNIASETINSGQETEVSLEVTNIGNMIGAEVIQLYIRDVECSVMKPLKELKGFTKISLSPGEKKTILFNIIPELLSFYDDTIRQWVVEPGEFEILLGSSSEDIRLKGRINFKNGIVKNFTEAPGDWQGVADTRVV